MKAIATELNDVIVLEPEVFYDDRGFFMESYNRDVVDRLIGTEEVFVQDNHSRSSGGTLRGLHYQIIKPQGKLVRVVAGEVYDVAVDLRRSSSTFGRWTGVTLSAENKRMLWVPKGFAHGFLVLSEAAEFVYKVTDYYCREGERCLLWSDAKLGIDWPLSQEPILSDKDAEGQTFDRLETFS